MAYQAVIAAIHTAGSHYDEMETLWDVRVIAGLGLDKDRYAVKRGMNREKRQVLLMDQETLQDLGLSPGTVRENITTRGLDIYSLASGQHVRLGSQVVLEITDPCEPCQRMDQIRPGLRKELAGRRGMLARVIESGRIKVGDSLTVMEHTARPSGG